MNSSRRLTRRKRKPFSYLPLLLLIIFGQVMRVSLLIRKRDAASFAAVDPLNAITILLLFGGLLLLLTPRGSVVLRKIFRSPLRFFMFYFALCGVSALWSGEMAYTVFRSAELLVNTVLMCWIIYELKTLEVALLSLIRFAAVWLVFGMLGKMRLVGIGMFINDNASACVAALGLVMTLGAWKEGIIRPHKLLLPGAVFAGGLLSGLSSASNVSAILGVSLVMVGIRHKSALFVQALVAVVVLSIGWNVIQSGVFNEWLMPGKTQAQIESLHGRTEMWRRYYKGIKERPILAYGFPVGEKRVRVLEDGTKFGAASAHNSIIGVAINTGVVGLVLTALAAMQMLMATHVSLTAGRAGGVTMVAVMATAFLNSLSYPVIGSHWNWPTTVVQGLAGIGLCYVWLPPRGTTGRRRRLRTQPRRGAESP
jgi:hypothetical protein